jgi:integrase
MEARKPGAHLYPWWDGDASNRALTAMSDYLSKLYAGIFEEAGAKGLRFHDLRHEAVSRMFERTRLTESQIMKVAGHKSHRMMLRYANLRGSDLADLLG